MSKQVIYPHGFPQRGEIYSVDFNRRKGQEIRKIRPALVISNDLQNQYDRYLVVAPLTSDELEEIRPFELLITVNKENGLEKDSKILFNQIHGVDKNARCREYLGKIDANLLKETNKKLKLVLSLE